MTGTNHDAALALLRSRVALGIRPGTARLAQLLDLMADPQVSYEVIHVVGTNGKTSTTLMVAEVLGAHGLTAGSFTSPPLRTVEEHFRAAGAMLPPEDLGPTLDEVLPFVELLEADGGPLLTEFELTAAMAFAWFAERPVDVAVVEAGLGGVDDATNVVAARVVVLTNVGLDHAEFLGPDPARIAAAKVGVLDDGAALVSGPLPPEADAVVAARVQEAGGAWYRLGVDVRVDSVTQAVGGWLVDVEGIHERYEDVFVPLHGRHQAGNAALAIGAAEALFGRALDADAVREGLARVRVAGRLEVLSGEPLVLVDVAHNVAGMEVVAAALDEEFLPTGWVVVGGLRGGRDPRWVFAPLQGQVTRFVATAAAVPAAVPPEEVAAGATAALGPEVTVEQAGSVAEAVARALGAVDVGGGILVTGSHAVVGEALTALAADE